MTTNAMKFTEEMKRTLSPPLTEEQAKEFVNTLKEYGKISAIKYIREILGIRLTASKEIVDRFMEHCGIQPKMPVDMVAEFVSDLEVYPSDIWLAFARDMVRKGWKK